MTTIARLPHDLEDRVTTFLESFRDASATLDLDAQRECFAETFLAGDGSGTRPVPREAFLRALPHRAAAAREAGVGRAELVDSSMIRLDAQWLVLRAEWSAPLSAGGHLPMTSTFLVHDDGSRLHICVYLNHTGLPLSTGAPDT